MRWLLPKAPLETLRRLRDGWKEVAPELLLEGWDSIGDPKKNRYEYERGLREARGDVNLALKQMPASELKDAIRQAMTLYLDLEDIYEILERERAFDSLVRSSAISNYLRKYSVPAALETVRHDMVFAVLLPLGRERINQIIKLLGGQPEAPDYESEAETNEAFVDGDTKQEARRL
jgi:hypothetical protein